MQFTKRQFAKLSEILGWTMDIDEGLGLGDEELLWDISAFKSHPVFVDLGVKVYILR